MLGGKILMTTDPYNRLKLEINGIKDVIEEYSPNGNIGNFVNGLEQALQEDKFDNVLYYLNEICIWYEQNINAIHSNEFEYNSDEHDRNKKMLEELKHELDSYDFNNCDTVKSSNSKQCEPKIFISHRSSDKKYGDALEKLICGLGVKKNRLIYTSHPLHKIPLDANIYDFLRENINNNVFVIILWSNEYLESPACLNEMGAAWVAQTDYTNIYTPDFSFGNPKYHECAVDTRKMGAILNGDDNCKANIIELMDKIIDIFNLQVDNQTRTYLLDQFILDIN